MGYNYPEYLNAKNGNRILLDIRKYLISKKINKRPPDYPEYVCEEINNIDNCKRNFRNIAKNYELVKFNNLYIKYYSDKKNKNINYDLFTVPFVQDIHKYIYDIHKQLGHRNHNTINEELKKRHIYFKGIYNTIQKVCKSCGICSIKIKTNMAKREKVKLIIFNKPRSRYIADITDIPTEIRANTNY